MNLQFNIIINVFSIGLLSIVYIHSLTHHEKGQLQYRLFAMMLLATIALLVVDIFSRFDGHPGTIYTTINSYGNFLIFLLVPVHPSLWLLYVHDQVHKDAEKTKKLIFPLVGVYTVHVIFLIVSQSFGWLYTIDSGNFYHRGPLFILATALSILLVIAAFVFVIVNRKNIEKRFFLSLAIFVIPPVMGFILQILFYGISFMLNSIVFSMLILLLNVQNRSIYTDYLTGVNNRKKLDAYLKDKVNSSSTEKTFSAILIDLNNFKHTNDTYGHSVGDVVLERTATLLASCLRTNDFIARFGGDEFCIVLDTSTVKDLESAVDRIQECLRKYNTCNESKYRIDLSMGYAVYDYFTHMRAEDFQKRIDILMYENKRSWKLLKNSQSV